MKLTYPRGLKVWAIALNMLANWGELQKMSIIWMKKNVGLKKVP